MIVLPESVEIWIAGQFGLIDFDNRYVVPLRRSCKNAVQYIVVQWPKSNPNFCDITWNLIEKMILHELFRVVSGFPRYIPCYIAKNQFHLGQCTMTNFSDDSDKQYGSIMGRVLCQNSLLTPFIQKCNNSWPNLLIHTVTYFFIQKIMNCFFFLRS